VHSKVRTQTSVIYQPAGFYPLIKISRMTCVMILDQPYKRVSSEWSPNDTKKLSLHWERKNDLHKQVSTECP
jgi:hypothetical protein